MIFRETEIIFNIKIRSGHRLKSKSQSTDISGTCDIFKKQMLQSKV